MSENVVEVFGNEANEEEEAEEYEDEIDVYADDLENDLITTLPSELNGPRRILDSYSMELDGDLDHFWKSPEERRRLER